MFKKHDAYMLGSRLRDVVVVGVIVVLLLLVVDVVVVNVFFLEYKLNEF